MKNFTWISRRILGLFFAGVVMVVCVSGARAAEQDSSYNDGNSWPGFGIIPEDTVFTNFYGGVGSGVMRSNSPGSNDDDSVSDIDTDKVGAVGRTFIGYEFTDNLAVEAGYHYLGKSEFEGVSSGSGVSWTAGYVRAEHEAQGGSLAGVVRLPLNDRWTLIGTAGMLWWESKETFIDNGIKSVESEHGQDYVFGGGIEYDIGVKDRFVYRAEIQKFVVDASEYDITAGTFSLVYMFP